jgi:hypothetical protein
MSAIVKEKSNSEYLNDASIILGIIVIMACLFGKVPKPFSTMIMIIIPILIAANYISLVWLTNPEYFPRKK